MIKQEPKILTFDIETTPIEAYTWGPKWETNLIQVQEESRILSYSAKWLNGKHITKGWPNYKGYKKGVKDDKAIVRDIWELFNELDILIVQNGQAFDVKTMNSRFLFHKLTPPSSYKVVDTKREAKKYLRLPSYSLNDMCFYFGIGRKEEHEGFPLWTKCMAGEKAAWKRMLRYNKKDVAITEKLYLVIRPFMSSHPNVNMYKKPGMFCPKCGTDKLNWEGWHRNKTTKYHSFSCKDCGSWGRDTHNVQEIKPLVSI